MYKLFRPEPITELVKRFQEFFFLLGCKFGEQGADKGGTRTFYRAAERRAHADIQGKQFVHAAQPGHEGAVELRSQPHPDDPSGPSQGRWRRRAAPEGLQGAVAAEPEPCLPAHQVGGGREGGAGDGDQAGAARRADGADEPCEPAGGLRAAAEHTDSYTDVADAAGRTQ